MLPFLLYIKFSFPVLLIHSRFKQYLSEDNIFNFSRITVHDIIKNVSGTKKFHKKKSILKETPSWYV